MGQAQRLGVRIGSPYKFSASYTVCKHHCPFIVYAGHDDLFISYPIPKGDCISRVNGLDCLSLGPQDFSTL